MSLAFDDAVRVTGARVLLGECAPRELRIATDTRTLHAGDTFIALRGEHFDGNDFAMEAAARGASALVLDREDAAPPGVTTLLVPDALRAYMSLAGEARERLHSVVAITGSTGKTTVKVLLEQLLAAVGIRSIAAPANENNEIGVSRLLLRALDRPDDVVVAEFGARHPNDIAKLTAIAKPNVGVLTNVGEAHLEIMGSREGLEAAKWALFSTGARAVLNLADDASRRRATSLARPPLWFFGGDRLPEVSARERVCAVLGSRLLFVASGKVSEYAIDVRIPGMHNRANLAAALAALVKLTEQNPEMVAFNDASHRERILSAIPHLALPKGRYERMVLANGMHVIYDAYNANPAGMIAALDAFSGEQGARRIAVLASMAELGAESETLHERVGEHAAATVDELIVGGEFAGALERGARRAGLSPERIARFSSNGEAARWLREHVRADDIVLLKGSRKYRLEEVVEELGGPL
jgi:UDP-N-acetylmuramoyl-tripeptide--D-alanyl-D-alanine ligase